MSYGGSSSGGGNIHTSGDVALSNPQNGQTLTYDGSVQKWGNQTPPITVVNAGSNATTARPAGALVVYWLCANGVTPTHAVAGDLIYQAS